MQSGKLSFCNIKKQEMRDDQPFAGWRSSLQKFLPFPTFLLSVNRYSDMGSYSKRQKTGVR
jgi:hypothetical protein